MNKIIIYAFGCAVLFISSTLLDDFSFSKSNTKSFWYLISDREGMYQSTVILVLKIILFVLTSYFVILGNKRGRGITAPRSGDIE